MAEDLSEMADTEAASTVSARRLPRYPAYRYSGVEWLGELPAHWDVQRLKEFATVRLSNVDKKTIENQDSIQLCNCVDVYYNEKITAKIQFMRATATPEQIRHFSLRTNDVLFAKDSETHTDIAVPAVVDEELPSVICGYHLAHIRPRETCNGVFLFWCISAIGPRDQYRIAANGITRFGLTGDTIRVGRFPLPPACEQRTIADFLDRETAKIDALVAKKERLIELLEDKRVALITRAVTKGLDPAVPMKDSGVDWLGEIPVRWSVHRLKRISPEISVGVVVNPSSYVSMEGVPFIYGSDIQEGNISREVSRRMSHEHNAELSKSRLLAGDLVTVRVGAPGVTAVVPPEMEGANCASVIILRRGSKFDSRWLCYAMNSRVIRFQVAIVQYGAAQEQFNVGHAVEFVVPTPPLAEQKLLAAFLDRETGGIDALLGKVWEAIDRLKELRTALISAAVTGKIDVRETMG